jgi:3-deoxy-7-phosphoheptulonate synthase
MSVLPTHVDAPAPPTPRRAGVKIAGHLVGEATFAVIAGPCSVVELGQTLRVARDVKAAGAPMLRGGAYKPRTYPQSFQGLQERGLEILLEAKRETGLPVVTEVLDAAAIDRALMVADVIQVGARNMQNTALLKALGRIDCAVLLKRGLAATIDETIGAAAYIRDGGNHRVVLCERGIRTFETAYRFTLDLMAVPILQQRSGLPVIVDPSHAAGDRGLVLALSKAAAAVGADGLIVEIDENPDLAPSDGAQQLHSADFDTFMEEVSRVARAEGRRVLRAA